LIDLGELINVMTKGTMIRLNFTKLLRNAPIVLQLIDRSIVNPEGVLEDVIVLIDSWEYPADFIVKKNKEKLNGYPLILGRPWLATIYAFIECKTRDMTIKIGQYDPDYFRHEMRAEI
jgi:hypothetical protein